MISAFILLLLYPLKGGQHAIFRHAIERLIGVRRYETTNEIIGEPLWWQWPIVLFLDGKILSTIIFGIITLNPLAALGWLVGVSPSLGEEIGAIGGVKGGWRDEGLSWGWKRGLQRGVFMGAMLTLTTGNLSYIIAGLTFPAAAWVGVSIEQLRSGNLRADWHWYEWLFSVALVTAFIFDFSIPQQ